MGIVRVQNETAVMGMDSIIQGKGRSQGKIFRE